MATTAILLAVLFVLLTCLQFCGNAEQGSGDAPPADAMPDELGSGDDQPANTTPEPPGPADTNDPSAVHSDSAVVEAGSGDAQPVNRKPIKR